MTIVRYDPFRDLRTLQEEVNRLFSTNLTRGFGEEGIGRGAWNPSVDIYENKDQIVLEAELPGMKREEIDISVHDGTLTISGERKYEEKNQDANPYRSERFFGRFHRTLALPKPVQADKAKANYKEGILKVILPKTEEAKPKQIQVNVN